MNNGKDVKDQTDFLININNYLNIVRKKWYVLLIVFLSVSLLGTYMTLRETYIYGAEVKLAFYTPDPQILSNMGGSSYQYYQMNRPSFFATEMEIVKSEPVAKRVAQSLNLIKDPDNEAEVESALKGIIGSLSVSVPKSAHVMSISSFSSDPEMAMKIANATAEAYIKYNDNRRYEAYRKSMGGITEQLADLEKKLEEAQKSLIEFIEKEKITSYGDDYGIFPRVPDRARSSDQTFFLEDLNKRRVELEITLSNLLEKYFEKHPKVVKTRNELSIINKKIVEEEKRIENEKHKRDKETIAAKQKEIRYSILKRKVEVNKHLYDTLIQKLKETDVGSEMDMNFVDIIEYAKLPKTPIAPNKTRLIIFTLILGLFLSAGTGFGIQYFDTSFKNVDELTNYIDYPVLATIPLYRKKDKRGALLLDSKEDDVSLKEAFRLLRTNLKFALSEVPSKHIMVTSSQKGEGKSTVTTNLGLVMAEAGTRTLLVDCDLRVRSINKFFGLNTDTGLSDYLQDKVSFDDILIKTVTKNLFIVSSGPGVDNPTLLFESNRMKKFLEDADKHFDQILLDSPPVGYVIDASLLSMIVDGILMVVEAGVVNRKAVMSSMDQLLKGKGKVHGIVFNKEAMINKSYYYKYYKYYSEDTRKTL